MKNKLLTLPLLFYSFIVYTQITVDQNDMPSSGDTIYYGVSGIPGFDPNQTGTAQTWDFSFLIPVTHRSDTILTVFQTPAVYNVVFNPLIANQAYINQTPPSFGGGITISEYYDFFKKSSTYYRKAGFGAMINSVPTPVKYDNPEIHYTFPLNYGTTDSSASSFGITIPGYGYFGQTINHKFFADGWGTLIIPYGTFNTLRVKATINITDTIFSEALQMGTTITRPTSYEYYWIAKNLDGHAIKVTQNGMAYSAEYLDSLSYTGVNNNNNIAINIFPVPASDYLYVTNNNFDFTEITVFDITGKTVISQQSNLKFVKIPVNSLKEGVYVLKAETSTGALYRRFSIIR